METQAHFKELLKLLEKHKCASGRDCAFQGNPEQMHFTVTKLIKYE
jgi:hypothetical protein